MRDRKTTLGVVTVTFNSASVIAGFMESLLAQQNVEFRAYVVDNCSSDLTLDYLTAHPDPRVEVIRSPSNVGVAEGNNLGIRAALAAGCSSILLINNDTAFDSHLFTYLSNALSVESCDMVVPKIVYFDVPTKIWCAGGYFSRLHGSSRHFGYGEDDHGQYDQQRLVRYAPTCCLLVKAGVFEQIGLMDENYFVYFDDTDFCYRAQQRGFRLLYLPHARVLHKVSSLTGGGESDFTVQFCTRNYVYYTLKNLPSWQLFFYLPLLQFRIVAKHILVKRRWTSLWMAEQAFFSGFSLFRSVRSRGLRQAEGHG